MRNRIFLFFILAIISSFYSCAVKKRAVSSTGSGLTAGEYISTYKDLAVNEMKRTGIPASITLAQGMIESDFGRSTLAREGNNHFGIKCHEDWTGATIRHNDDKRNECFRKYIRAEESFYDHSDFLKSESRYRFLFDIGPTEYKEWARGLKKAGYATNPDYANMLIRKIEENNLWNFDREYNVASLPPQTTVPVSDSLPIKAPEGNIVKPPVINGNTSISAKVPRIMENNRIQFIIVKDGDTKLNLENEFQLLKWELARYNELADDFKLIPGLILYLQPKTG
jgi:hypothetical protein